MKDIGVSKFVYAILVIITIFIIFYSCGDSYHSRKKLVTELSLLYNENRTEFDKICDYFYSDSLSKRFAFRYQDGKIDIDDGHSYIKIDSIYQIKDNLDVYQILTFMEKERIRIISSNSKEGWITLSFEDFKYPCFNFWYKRNFDPNDPDVKEQIENIKNRKTKDWIYVLGDKWFIHGVKCF